jgi:hypothetical protein
MLQDALLAWILSGRLQSRLARVPREILMQLIENRIAIQCWECHQPTRVRPCEHCHCETPEENREQFAEEEKLMDLVFQHMGHGYRLRDPHDAESPCTLVPDPRWPVPVTFKATLTEVPERIVALLKIDRYRRISQLPEHTTNQKIGWRESGFPDGADYYACTQ